MQKSTLERVIEVLSCAVAEGISISKAARSLGMCRNVVHRDIKILLNKPPTNTPEYRKFIKLYTQISGELEIEVINNSSVRETADAEVVNESKENELKDRQDETVDSSEGFDGRSVGTPMRNEKGIITSYAYHILVRDRPALQGELSREEMALICNRYSSLDGGDASQREVAMDFPQFTLRDIKRIMRTFNITKHSPPLAPHQIEEMSTEEAATFVFNLREGNLLRRLNNSRSREIETLYKDLLSRHLRLQERVDFQDRIFGSIKNSLEEGTLNAPRSSYTRPRGQTSDRLYVFLADPHAGKFYQAHEGEWRGYDQHIMADRFEQITTRILDTYHRGEFTRITFLSLGDLLETILEDGMHPGHAHTLDLVAEAQVMAIIGCIGKMLQTLLTATSCEIEFLGVGGNHDRIGESRNDDQRRTGARLVYGFLQTQFEGRVHFEFPLSGVISLQRENIGIIALHGDTVLAKKRPADLIHLKGFGRNVYHVIVEGHLHAFNAVDGSNYTKIIMPAITSADSYIIDQIGERSTPGFVIGREYEKRIEVQRIPLF